jgi:hypothetical protein
MEEVLISVMVIEVVISCCHGRGVSHYNGDKGGNQLL